MKLVFPNTIIYPPYCVFTDKKLPDFTQLVSTLCSHEFPLSRRHDSPRRLGQSAVERVGQSAAGGTWHQHRHKNIWKCISKHWKVKDIKISWRQNRWKDHGFLERIMQLFHLWVVTIEWRLFQVWHIWALHLAPDTPSIFHWHGCSLFKAKRTTSNAQSCCRSLWFPNKKSQHFFNHARKQHERNYVPNDPFSSPPGSRGKLNVINPKK